MLIISTSCQPERAYKPGRRDTLQFNLNTGTFPFLILADSCRDLTINQLINQSNNLYLHSPLLQIRNIWTDNCLLNKVTLTRRLYTTLKIDVRFNKECFLWRAAVETHCNIGTKITGIRTRIPGFSPKISLFKLTHAVTFWANRRRTLSSNNEV